MAYINLTNREVLRLFNTSVFLETDDCFFRCNKATLNAVEIIDKDDMAYLNFRYTEIVEKLKQGK